MLSTSLLKVRYVSSISGGRDNRDYLAVLKAVADRDFPEVLAKSQGRIGCRENVENCVYISYFILHDA